MSFNPLESIARYRSSGGVGKSPGPESDAGSSLGDLRAYQATHSPRGKSVAGPSASPRLAMSQRRYGEQMEVRLELENEVARLKKQVTALKGDNKKMEREVENSKDQMKAQKSKYEDIIAGLRNQLASKQHLTGAAGNTIHSSHLRNSGNGHQLSSVNEVISPTRFPPRESATRTSHSSYKNDKNENRPFNGHQQQQDDHNNRTNTNQEPISGFQEPTFSELMRLSAKEMDEGVPHPSVFGSTLRKHEPVDWSDKIEAIKTGQSHMMAPKSGGGGGGGGGEKLGGQMSASQLMTSYRYSDDPQDIPVIEIDLSRG